MDSYVDVIATYKDVPERISIHLSLQDIGSNPKKSRDVIMSPTTNFDAWEKESERVRKVKSALHVPDEWQMPGLETL